MLELATCLMGLLRFKEVLSQFNVRKMFGEDDGKRADSGNIYNEDVIDQKTVGRVLLSREWWSYDALVWAVSTVPHLFVFASRSCLCHKPQQRRFVFR